MAYVVRDHRSAARWLTGLVASVVVVVVVSLATGRWWVAAIGVPLSLLAVGQRVRADTTPLRADDVGISLGGRWSAWQDVDEVLVDGSGVEVTLGERSPLPPWAQGRVTGGVADERLRLTQHLRAEPGRVVEGIRSEAPGSVLVRAR